MTANISTTHDVRLNAKTGKVSFPCEDEILRLREALLRIGVIAEAQREIAYHNTVKYPPAHETGPHYQFGKVQGKFGEIRDLAFDAVQERTDV